LNPVIVIPTYVMGRRMAQTNDVIGVYDHMTPINHQGELGRCLSSIREHVVGVPIALVIASEKGMEDEAQRKIEDIASGFPELDISIIGAQKEEALHNRMVQMGLGELCNGISLIGYGALRNMGLLFAAVRGYDEVIYIDDDEVIEDDAFLEKACYGLGGLTPKGIPILVKSGYYLDKSGGYRAHDKGKWYNRFWQRHKGFNQWIDAAMHGPRLTRSNTLCGGLMAIQREAFTRVSFDANIARGEDLDYFLNVRMYGSEVWFDNAWVIRHLPPTERSEARRFRQEIYRWLYEHQKLEYAKSQVDLYQITPKSLYPYPGPFLESRMLKNIRWTALLRSIGIPEARQGYIKAAMIARREAVDYAQRYCVEYFSFQYAWPRAIMLLEQDPATQGIFEYGRKESLEGEALDAWRQADINGTYDSVVTEYARSGDTSGVFRSAAEYFSKQQSDQTLPPVEPTAQPRSRAWKTVERQPTPRSARVKEFYADDRNSSAKFLASEVEAPDVLTSPAPVETDAYADEASAFGKVRPSWAQALYERREQKRGSSLPTKSPEASSPRKDPPAPVIDKDTQDLLGEFVLDLDSIKRGSDGT
jgi:hypothetical protein